MEETYSQRVVMEFDAGDHPPSSTETTLDPDLEPNVTTGYIDPQFLPKR